VTQSQVDAIRAARTEDDGFIEDVRQVDGFERFLATPTFKDVSRAVSPSPLLSRRLAVRSLALVVRGSTIVNGESYTKGPRSSPVLARKPASSPERYCLRFSRVFTSAVSSAIECLVRFATDRFRCAHTRSTGLNSWAYGGSR